MICGARVMVDEVGERLRTMSVDPAKIHTESWG
jgi:ferredoxin-NADP reductase